MRTPNTTRTPSIATKRSSFSLYVERLLAKMPIVVDARTCTRGSIDVDYASVAILAQVCVVCGLGFLVRHELVLPFAGAFGDDNVPAT